MKNYEEKEKSKKRACRRKNLVAPFDRIAVVFGIDWIKSLFAEKLALSVPFEILISLRKLKHIEVPDLQATALTILPPKITCRILSNSTEKYPTHKVRLDTKEALFKICESFGNEQIEYEQSSVPLDLHRLAALQTSGWNIEAQLSFDALHRCHNKRCFNPEHLYFGQKDTNRSTDFCPAYIIINGVIVHCCTHSPQCLVPGPRAPTNI